MCSEAKKKCIYAVSKQLGIDVDWQGIGKLSDEEASSKIHELKSQLEASKPKTNRSETELNINDPRLGMCYKLVYRTAQPSYWREHKEVFKREVVAAYKLAKETEEAVKSALLAPKIKVKCDFCHNITINPISLDNGSHVVCEVCAEKNRKDNKHDGGLPEDVVIPMSIMQTLRTKMGA